MSNTLTVGKNTSVMELRQFLNDSEPGGKLRGKPTADGGYVLYVDGKSSSMLDRISGKARERNKAASDGVKMVFRNFEQLSQRNGVHGNTFSKLFEQIGKRCSLHDRSALRSDDVLRLSRGVALIGNRLGFKAQPPLPPASPLPAHIVTARGPKLPVAIDQGQLAAVANLLPCATNDVGRTAAIDALTTLIDSAVTASNASGTALKALSMSQGDDLKAKVATAITVELAASGQAVPAGFHDLLAEAFEGFASSRLGTRQTTPFVDTPIVWQGVTITKPLPEISIGKRVFKAESQLGEGGLGNVYLYVNKSDHNDRIAFKICKPDAVGRDPVMVRADTISEVLAHDAAQAGGSTNILKLEGAVRLSEGTIGIALQTAPHGSVWDLASTLNDFIGSGPGQLTQAQANVVRLTIVRDMLLGLQSLENAGIMHLDFKSPNCLIGGDGRAKVIDFGTSVKADQLAYRDFPTVTENPRYLSPEYLKARQDVEKLAKAGRDEYAEGFETAMRMIYPDADKRTKERAMQNIAALRDDKFIDKAISTLNPVIDRRHDTWGAGIALLEMFQGHDLLTELKFNSDVMDDVIAWTKGGTEAIAPNTTGPLPRDSHGKLRAIGRSTGDPDVDDLLNKMLASDPANRISLADALNHPAFTRKGVGDPNVIAFFPKMLAKQDLFVSKRDQIAGMSELLETIDKRLKEFNADLTPTQVEILNAGTVSQDDRAAMITALSPENRAKMNALISRLDQENSKIDVLDQAIHTFQTTLKAGKAAFDLATGAIDGSI